MVGFNHNQIRELLQGFQDGIMDYIRGLRGGRLRRERPRLGFLLRGMGVYYHDFINITYELFLGRILKERVQEIFYLSIFGLFGLKIIVHKSG